MLFKVGIQSAAISATGAMPGRSHATRLSIFDANETEQDLDAEQDLTGLSSKEVCETS